MYTSATDRAPYMRRVTLKYLLAALLLIVCAAVYEYFSHGVYSAYMIGMFAIPLLLGALPSAVFWKKRRVPHADVRHLWGAGVATLTAGSFMTGVLEIYGTTSRLTPVYLAAGAALLAAAAAVWLAASGSRSGKHTV